MKDDKQELMLHHNRRRRVDRLVGKIRELTNDGLLELLVDRELLVLGLNKARQRQADTWHARVRNSLIQGVGLVIQHAEARCVRQLALASDHVAIGADVRGENVTGSSNHSIGLLVMDKHHTAAGVVLPHRAVHRVRNRIAIHGNNKLALDGVNGNLRPNAL